MKYSKGMRSAEHGKIHYLRRYLSWRNVIVGLFVFVWIQLLLMIWNNGHRNEDVGEFKSIIILKLPRTGSTWFTEMMNNLPYVYVSKEIIQGGDKKKYSLAEMENHLQKALLSPTDKLASCRSWFSTSRFREDYLFHSNWKWWTKLQGVGFTLNPEHTIHSPSLTTPNDFSSEITDQTQHLNWSYVFHYKNKHKKYILVLIRSNLMKMIVSGLLGEQMRRHCGQSNLPATQPTLFSHSLFMFSSSSSSCAKAIEGFQINVTEFAQIGLQWVDRYEQFHRFLQEEIFSRPQEEGIAVRYVYYEDLLMDKAVAMSNVLTFLDIPIPPIPSYAATHPLRTNSPESQDTDPEYEYENNQPKRKVVKNDRRERIEYYLNRNHNRWKKRTSDHLSDTISNYDTLFDRLDALPRCAGLVDQLEGYSYIIPKDWFARHPERRTIRNCLQSLL